MDHSDDVMTSAMEVSRHCHALFHGVPLVIASTALVDLHSTLLSHLSVELHAVELARYNSAVLKLARLKKAERAHET
jgi:hypothetical protein